MCVPLTAGCQVYFKRHQGLLGIRRDQVADHRAIHAQFNRCHAILGSGMVADVNWTHRQGGAADRRIDERLEWIGLLIGCLFTAPQADGDTFSSTAGQ